MNVAYYNRYNTRISFSGNQEPGGDPDLTGAISTVLTSNLTANRVVVSNASGKLEASPITVTKVNYLTDVTSNIQAQLDGKEPTLTKGNLTESISSVLTITGGTGAIIGSGLTIRVLAAGAGQSGYLSTTDWNTFNNKLTGSLTSAYVFVGNGSNVATGVPITGDIGITNAGVTSITAGAIVNADVNASAAIARSKTASGTAYRILANSAAGVMSENAAITALSAVVSDANGQLSASATTSTQIGFLSTSTSDIQVQLDTLIVGLPTNALIQAPTAAQDGFAITWDDGIGEWALTDPVIQGIPVAGTARQFLGKNSGTDYDASWLDLVTTDITDITATAAELNILDGATLTVTELNYVDGVTSAIQTQLDAKQSSSLAFNAIWVGNGSGIAAQLSPGTPGYVLTSVGGAPQWQPSAGGIGGSTGSVDNSLIRANGTGGSTVQASSLWTISDFGNATIGSGSAITQYYIDTDGSANEVDLRFRSKRVSAAAGFTQFYINGSSDSFGMTNGAELCDFVLSSGLVHIASADAFEIEAQGGDFLLKSYDHIFLQPSDGGTIGNVGLFTASVADWQDMDGGVFIANATVVPTDNPTGGGFLYAEGGALKYRGSGGTVTTIGPA